MLSDLLAGDGDPGQRARFDDHRRGCAPCSETWAVFQGIIHDMQGLPLQARDPVVRARLREALAQEQQELVTAMTPVLEQWRSGALHASADSVRSRLESAVRSPRKVARPASRRRSFWSRRAAWVESAALAMVAGLVLVVLFRGNEAALAWGQRMAPESLGSVLAAIAETPYRAFFLPSLFALFGSLMALLSFPLLIQGTMAASTLPSRAAPRLAFAGAWGARERGES